MFCNRCGKTIKPGEEACRFCGSPVGGQPSADGARQSAPPDGGRGKGGAPYTRTTYMSTASEEREEADTPESVLSRTTYRPVLSDEEALPDDRPEETEPVGELEPAETDERIEEAAPQSEPADEKKEPAQAEDIPSPRAKFVPVTRAGIRPEVEERMRREEERRRREQERAERPRPQIPAFGRARKRDDEAAPEQAEAESAAFSPEREEEDGVRIKPSFSLASLGGTRLVKTVVAALCVVALIVGGVIWVGFVTQKRANIQDVSYSAYSEGLALLDKRLSDEYKDQFKDTYLNNLAYLGTLQAEVTASYEALMPAEPMANDRAFVDALLAIQSAIDTALTYEQLSVDNDALADTAARAWEQINGGVTALKAATTAAQLESVEQALDMSALATPAPDTIDTSAYSTLRKGLMNSTDVKKMQERLTELNYFNAECDGSFGTKTETAVKRFQNAVGLTVDGVATPEMQALLYADDAPVRKVSATPSPTVAPTGTPVPAAPEAT